MNYYYYIAGLPDLQQDTPKSVPPMTELLDELSHVLTTKDMELLNILRCRYDNENLLRLMKDKEAELNPLGVLSREDWLQLMEIMDNSDELHKPKDTRLLPYVLEFYKLTKKENQENRIRFTEDCLAALYYEYGMHSRNKFVAEWFEFNLNVNNILTAFACRKHNWDVKSAIVGDNEIANIIRHSVSSRDFNLKNELDYFDTLANIANTHNLLERERQIDALKWTWLEEHTFFNYFTIERILSFWLKCELMHRWDNLTIEQGAEIFRNMINVLKKEVQF